MLARRLIACLDVRDGRVVKGVNFGGLSDAGDPAALAGALQREGIDELVGARRHRHARRPPRARSTRLRAVARELFIPLAVGGGIRSLDDARAMIDAGADKVSLNSAALPIRRSSRRLSRDLRQPGRHRRDRCEA